MTLRSRATAQHGYISIETQGPKHSVFLRILQTHSQSEYSITSGGVKGEKSVLTLYVPAVFYRRSAGEVRCVGR